MSTNNPSQKSVVLECSAKPSLGWKLGSPGLIWQKIQEPLTQDADLIGVVGVNCDMKDGTGIFTRHDNNEYPAKYFDIF